MDHYRSTRCWGEQRPSRRRASDASGTVEVKRPSADDAHGDEIPSKDGMDKLERAKLSFSCDMNPTMSWRGCFDSDDGQVLDSAEVHESIR